MVPPVVVPPAAEQLAPPSVPVAAPSWEWPLEQLPAPQVAEPSVAPPVVAVVEDVEVSEVVELVVLPLAPLPPPQAERPRSAEAAITSVFFVVPVMIVFPSRFEPGSRPGGRHPTPIGPLGLQLRVSDGS